MNPQRAAERELLRRLRLLEPYQSAKETHRTVEFYVDERDAIRTIREYGDQRVERARFADGIKRVKKGQRRGRTSD